MPTPKHPARVRVRPIGSSGDFSLPPAKASRGGQPPRRGGRAPGPASPIDGITAAYQRTIGAWRSLRRSLSCAPWSSVAERRRPRHPPTARGHLWILVNALCGAVIGVSCYQWALAPHPAGLCCRSSRPRRWSSFRSAICSRASGRPAARSSRSHCRGRRRGAHPGPIAGSTSSDPTNSSGRKRRPRSRMI